MDALPAVILTFIAICIIYALKGIFPFGSDTVAYMDMWQMNVPIYYHIYDVLHGDKSLFYDLYTGLGMNMTESAAICSLISPFNLLFYFTPRSGILYFMSFFNAAKFITGTFTMSAFLRYRFKRAHIYWRTIASFAYGLCGFNLVYGTNSQWLDMAALFPLLMIALDYSMRTRRILPYALALGGFMIVNPYIGVITLIFIFLASGANILFVTKKREKSLAMLNLGLGTALGVGISAVILLPFITQMGRTMRAEQGTFSKMIAIIRGTLYYQTETNIQKYWMLWGTAVAAAMVIVGLFAAKRRFRKKFCILICLAVLVMPVFFESIDLLWHGGSYAQFPMRFGFLLSFMMWTSAIALVRYVPSLNLFFLRRNMSKSLLRKILSVIWFIICIALIPAVARFLTSEFLHIEPQHKILLSVMLFSVIAIYAIICLSLYKVPILRLTLASFVIGEIIAGGYLHVGDPFLDEWFLVDTDNNFAAEIHEVSDKIEPVDSKTIRMKNADARFTSNYPMMMQRSALSNWTHSVDSQVQGAYKKMGYSTIYTRLIDTGGTVFSDALFNVRDVLTMTELSPDSYNYVDTFNGLNYYQTKYRFGFGFVANETLLKSPESGAFMIQNHIYNSMGGEGELFKTFKTSTFCDENIVQNIEYGETYTTYTLKIEGHQNLYVADAVSMTLYVNDKQLVIPNCGKEYYGYPTNFNNGFIDCGAFTDETIKLRIEYFNGVSDYYLLMGLMDYDLLDSLTNSYNPAHLEKEGKSSFRLSAFATNDSQYLFIPLTYDDGLRCKVNGKKADVVKISGCFSAVKLDNGENTVKISYFPPKMGTGLLISLLSLAMLLIYSQLILKRKRPKPRIFVRIPAIIIFALLWCGFITIFYILPLILPNIDKIRAIIERTKL